MIEWEKFVENCYQIPYYKCWITNTWFNAFRHVQRIVLKSIKRFNYRVSKVCSWMHFEFILHSLIKNSNRPNFVLNYELAWVKSQLFHSKFLILLDLVTNSNSKIEKNSFSHHSAHHIALILSMHNLKVYSYLAFFLKISYTISQYTKSSKPYSRLTIN